MRLVISERKPAAIPTVFVSRSEEAMATTAQAMAKKNETTEKTIIRVSYFGEGVPTAPEMHPVRKKRESAQKVTPVRMCAILFIFEVRALWSRVIPVQESGEPFQQHVG